MNRRDFDHLRDRHYDLIKSINDAKGKDYAGDEDALANFKDAAKKLGVTPFQVWAVYHHKHQSAIDSFIREGKVESEPIEGRIHDAILYLFLLLGLIADEETPGSIDKFCLAVDPQRGFVCALEPMHAGPHTTGKGTREEYVWHDRPHDSGYGKVGA